MMRLQAAKIGTEMRRGKKEKITSRVEVLKRRNSHGLLEHSNVWSILQFNS